MQADQDEQGIDHIAKSCIDGSNDQNRTRRIFHICLIIVTTDTRGPEILRTKFFFNEKQGMFITQEQGITANLAQIGVAIKA